MEKRQVRRAWTGGRGPFDAVLKKIATDEWHESYTRMRTNGSKGKKSDDEECRQFEESKETTTTAQGGTLALGVSNVIQFPHT